MVPAGDEPSYPFLIAGATVAPGSRRYLELGLPQAFGHAELTMPVVVCHGRRRGPAMFVSAAVHGDEILGTEIIRRLLGLVLRKRLRGTLVAVPVVNAYGFITQQRYLPDRRDLNRSFPGSPTGSQAARLADLFMREIVQRCDFGVDLHSGALHRDNLPQIRGRLDQPAVENLARAFGVPVLLNSELRDGSLRAAASAIGKPLLVYEGGEALRFDEAAIRAGVQGCLNVMARTGILPQRPRRVVEPFLARGSSWLRATASGLMRPQVRLGERVGVGQVVARISEPTGRSETEVRADVDGIVIGRLNLPMVNEGDAVCHLGIFSDQADTAEIAGSIEDYDADLRRVFAGEREPRS
jgi:predicted deacylase